MSTLSNRAYIIGTGSETDTFDEFTPNISNCPLTYILTVTPTVPYSEQAFILDDATRTITISSSLETSEGSYTLRVSA